MQRLAVDKVQRPRRTSEFHEEPGTATKRQTRIIRRGPSSVESTPATLGTAQKVIQRQRISATGSASRSRPTPQKTPTNSARALFTSEQQRGNSGIALHNDKKWVQEQTLRIIDYLKKAWTPSGMPGINEDFFKRSNCLKQMSIKQFVSIINYFLHFIWGNKFTVGNNHVEDIVKILQKLNYPHQVNKSWLKTPNTTYSFGNVIVLLDFLMDFVSDSSLEFSLLETQETTSEDDELEPDVEFKTELLQNCQESFFVWDKQLDEDFEKVKRQTANLLVQKRCGAASLDALDIEIDRLYKQFDAVLKQRPHIAPEDERECERLKKFHHNIRNEIDEIREEYKRGYLQLEQILGTKNYCNTEIERLEKENAAHQMAIRKQICTVQQRDTYFDKRQVLRTELQCYERAINDLEERDCRQQVQLSNAKKKLTEEIEHLNTILRDIIFTLAITESQQQLQLPLNADFPIIERLIPQLTVLKNTIYSEIQKTKELLDQYETQFKKLNNEVFVVNEPHKKALDAALTSVLKKQEEFKKRMIKESETLAVRQQKQELELSQIQMETENLQQNLQFAQKECRQLEVECEDMLSKAEKEHSESAEARRKCLDEFEAGLNICVNRLNELEKIVLCNKENQPPERE